MFLALRERHDFIGITMDEQQRRVNPSDFSFVLNHAQRAAPPMEQALQPYRPVKTSVPQVLTQRMGVSPPTLLPLLFLAIPHAE